MKFAVIGTTRRQKVGFFFKPDNLQIHSNEGKGKEKKKERGGRREEKRKKAKIAFIIATLEKKNVGHKRSIWR